ncbi:YhjD/YihY/BrkB family envelope integrity protein [Planosporangium sp. 12N6]|uniref:YihY/virulence factor BrkB family protein n=1 Tax=Planosporangium spinosum TaxID=3402278 RepID=UPI003CF6F803
MAHRILHRSAADRSRRSRHETPAEGRPADRAEDRTDSSAEDRTNSSAEEHTDSRAEDRTDDRPRVPRQRDRRAEQVPERPTAQQGPSGPTELGKRSWWEVLKRTAKEFQSDNLGDWAAALTYYGVLSMFPGLLLLISVLRLTGPGTTAALINSVTGVAPGPAREVLRSAAASLERGQQTTAGAVAVIGLVGALWSASGYIGAFMRACNSIYDVPEGRPTWKTLPIRLGVTVLMVVFLAVIALSVVFTGTLAGQFGKHLGFGTGAVRVWDIVKWPVLVVLVSLLFAVLYWVAPNARSGGFRWLTPGGLLAVAVWLVASAGFALYVANFGSYNKTYGSLAGVIIFLVWLWISNIAILLGAEFDAELQRSRAAQAGHPPDREPYIDLRDTRKVHDAERRDSDLG